MTTQTIAQSAQPNLVRTALRLDSVVVALSGLILTMASQQVVNLLGVGTSGMMIIGGLVFLVYAADLWWISSKNPINRTWASIPPVLNVVWVVASAAILFGNLLPLTTAGWWTVAIVADIVGLIAAFQFYALCRK